MTGCIRVSTGRFLTAALAAGCVVLMAAQAVAATPVEGCDQRVLDTMQAAAETRVTESKAVDDEIYTMDDSVLALTCFNQSAAIAGEQAGKVFSGDFRAELAPVIDDALASMYQNFKTYSTGSVLASGIDYTSGAATKVDKATSPLPAYNCDQPTKLWNAVNSQGVKPGVPYTTFDDMLNGDLSSGGTLPGTAGGLGANAAQTKSSAKAQATYKALKTNYSIMPTGKNNPNPVYTNKPTPCQVLVTAGALLAGTVCP